MPYIGKSPVSGGFHKLDALTASATATYALTLGGAAYFPETANQLLVSLNGVIQAPQDSFTVSGSNLVFDSALTASDSIDFVVALGDVLGVGSVTDGAITKAKLGTTELDLATIKDSTGTNTAMTICSNGKVILNQVGTGEFYRTGTFTPAYSSTSASNINASIFAAYTHQVGFYTRIGNIVHAQISLKMPASRTYVNGGGNGQGLQVINLPFNVANNANQHSGISCGEFSEFTGWADSYTPMGYALINTKRIRLTIASSDGIVESSTTYVNNANSLLAFSITYPTDEA